MYELIFKDLDSDKEIKKIVGSRFLLLECLKRVCYSDNLKLLSFTCGK